MERENEGPPVALPEGGKYVYCIIRSREPREFAVAGIGGATRVYTIAHDGLAAVVSDTPIAIYDPTRENALTHESVNEAVMKEFTLIPMSFGTVFRSTGDVMELLRSAHGAFSDVLDKMNDKIEFGLKILWDREKALAVIEQENEQIRKLREEITRNSGTSTYFARMQLGRLVESALEALSLRYVAEIHDALKVLAVASRTNKPIGDRMILNAAFLVDRGLEARFDALVRDVGSRYDGVLSFLYSGPWPPYNFVNIKLKLEKAE